MGKQTFIDRARAWLRRHNVIRLLLFWLLVLTLPVHLVVLAILTGLQEVWEDRRLLYNDLLSINAEIWADLRKDWRQWKERGYE